MMTEEIIKEVLSKKNITWKQRKKLDELLEDVKCFYNSDTGTFHVSGGALITIHQKQVLPKKPRTWNKFIKLQEKMLKNKSYPASSWIGSAKKIRDFEKKHKITFSYDINNDELSLINR